MSQKKLKKKWPQVNGRPFVFQTKCTDSNSVGHIGLIVNRQTTFLSRKEMPDRGRLNPLTFNKKKYSLLIRLGSLTCLVIFCIYIFYIFIFSKNIFSKNIFSINILFFFEQKKIKGKVAIGRARYLLNIVFSHLDVRFISFPIFMQIAEKTIYKQNIVQLTNKIYLFKQIYCQKPIQTFISEKSEKKEYSLMGKIGSFKLQIFCSSQDALV